MTTQEKTQAIAEAIKKACPDLGYQRITLSYILRWLNTMTISVLTYSDGFMSKVDHDGPLSISRYNLKQDTLEAQSPEFIDFLYSFLS